MAILFKNANTPAEGVGNAFSNAMTVLAGGLNVVAFALLLARAPGDVPALSGPVSYGGQAMTSTGSPYQSGAGSFLFDIYALAAPPTGSNLLVFNGDAVTTVLEANLVAFSGVHQATPFRAGTVNARQANPGSGSEPITISTAIGDVTLTLTTNGGSNITATDKTSDGINNALNRTYGSDHTDAAGVANTHTWTAVAGNFVVEFGVSIQPAAAAASGGGIYTEKRVVADKQFQNQRVVRYG